MTIFKKIMFSQDAIVLTYESYNSMIYVIVWPH